MQDLMIKAIRFRAFKRLADAKLPLEPFTLLIGPNGSGKSTVLEAVILSAQMAASGAPSEFGGDRKYRDLVTSGLREDGRIEARFEWSFRNKSVEIVATWRPAQADMSLNGFPSSDAAKPYAHHLSKARVFSFNANALARAVPLRPNAQLETDGLNLAAVLDQLRDSEPERFADMVAEFCRCLPEFDHVLFKTPAEGQRSLLFRQRSTGFKLPATSVSDGTLVALGLLTLAYIPNPPSILLLEQPDRELHPRLMRDLKDVIYRLAYPADFNETRDPVQVIATTHSPYFLDEFRHHRDEVVILEASEDGTRFNRLSDFGDQLHDELEKQHLGDLWYTGVLGGVPIPR